MAKRMKEGNYSRFGAGKMADGICFTFEGAKECDCAVRIYDRRAKNSTEAGYEDFSVPDDFCIGAVYRVSIVGCSSLL